jgi:hypothetical protein
MVRLSVVVATAASAPLGTRPFGAALGVACTMCVLCGCTLQPRNPARYSPYKGYLSALPSPCCRRTHVACAPLFVLLSCFLHLTTRFVCSILLCCMCVLYFFWGQCCVEECVREKLWLTQSDLLVDTAKCRCSAGRPKARRASDPVAAIPHAACALVSAALLCCFWCQAGTVAHTSMHVLSC